MGDGGGEALRLTWRDLMEETKQASSTPTRKSGAAPMSSSHKSSKPAPAFRAVVPAELLPGPDYALRAAEEKPRSSRGLGASAALILERAKAASGRRLMTGAIHTSVRTAKAKATRSAQAFAVEASKAASAAGASVGSSGAASSSDKNGKSVNARDRSLSALVSAKHVNDWDEDEKAHPAGFQKSGGGLVVTSYSRVQTEKTVEFPRTHRAVFSPHSHWRIWWDAFMLLCTCYVMLVTPFELTRGRRVPSDAEPPRPATPPPPL